LGAERVERRLAAILAADVAGYSRLVERDEAGTIAHLRALRRDVIDPKIAGAQGTHRQDHARRADCRVSERRRSRRLGRRAATGLRQTITILARTSASNSASASIRAM